MKTMNISETIAAFDLKVVLFSQVKEIKGVNEFNYVSIERSR